MDANLSTGESGKPVSLKDLADPKEQSPLLGGSFAEIPAVKETNPQLTKSHTAFQQSQVSLS